MFHFLPSLIESLKPVSSVTDGFGWVRSMDVRTIPLGPQTLHWDGIIHIKIAFLSSGRVLQMFNLIVTVGNLYRNNFLSYLLKLKVVHETDNR